MLIIKRKIFVFINKFLNLNILLIYYRKNITKNSEEVILDCEKKSKTHTYFNVASISHSHNHKSVAYNIDTNGSEYFSIFIEDIDYRCVVLNLYKLINSNLFNQIF